MNGHHEAGRIPPSQGDDEALLDLVTKLIRRAKEDASFLPTRVIVIAEVVDESGHDQIFTVQTHHPAWVSIGMLSAAQMQANQLLANAYANRHEGDEHD